VRFEAWASLVAHPPRCVSCLVLADLVLSCHVVSYVALVCGILFRFLLGRGHYVCPTVCAGCSSIRSWRRFSGRVSSCIELPRRALCCLLLPLPISTRCILSRPIPYNPQLRCICASYWLDGAVHILSCRMPYCLVSSCLVVLVLSLLVLSRLVSSCLVLSCLVVSLASPSQPCAFYVLRALRVLSPALCSLVPFGNPLSLWESKMSRRGSRSASRCQDLRGHGPRVPGSAAQRSRPISAWAAPFPTEHGRQIPG
jgi:hypothetical protein